MLSNNLKNIVFMTLVSIAALSAAPSANAQDSAQACDVFETMMATTPVPPQTVSAVKRFQTVIARRSENTDLVLLGDSLMDNWDKTVGEDFPGRSVWNFGLGQDRTQNTLWRLEQPDANVTSVKPRDVVILVGTNNMADTSATACGVVTGVKAVVAKAAELWPEASIFLVGIPPRGVDFKSSNDTRLQINNSLREYAETASNIAFVQLDDNEITCGYYEKPALDAKDIRCGPTRAYECSNYKPDNLHFDRPGYTVLRRALSAASLSKFKIDRLN